MKEKKQLCDEKSVIKNFLSKHVVLCSASSDFVIRNLRYEVAFAINTETGVCEQ